MICSARQSLYSALTWGFGIRDFATVELRN